MLIYRVIQEGLTNVLRHSGAKEVFINLNIRKDMVKLTIEDNGVGFDYDRLFKAQDSPQGPLGIIIMRERVEMLDGIFHIESSPGNGTFIDIGIPVE